MRRTTLGPVTELATLLQSAGAVVALTGAGCSTESGIPDYRGPNGTWHRRRPMLHNEFLRSEESRRYFWARNYAAWPRFSSTLPNRSHYALAELESSRGLRLITQNVDGLHARAGSRKIIDLHGRSDEVICLSCRSITSRGALQSELDVLNEGWTARLGLMNADGDVEISYEDTTSFTVPDCDQCGGMLKPNVVFFGDSVPRAVVDDAMGRVRSADLLLVVGSSLTVWSGFRFARAAAECQVPMVIINQGPTRADDLATLKIDANCGEVLEQVAGL